MITKTNIIILAVGMLFIVGCACASSRMVLKSYLVSDVERKVEIGMSGDEVFLRMGAPKIRGKNMWEYWIEEDCKSAIGYQVYFENNKVIKIIKNELGKCHVGCSQVDM